MKYKNILVTGGSGFIGSNFIHNILKTENVKIFNIDKLTYAGNNSNHQHLENNNNYSFIKGDVTDKRLINNILKEKSINCVVHFAAESHVDRSIDNPEEFLNTNIYGTYNLLNCSLEHYKSTKEFVFIHISTDEVYGTLLDDESPFIETNQYLPNSPYSASKAASDMLVRAWHHTYGLPTITTNCSNNYGPYQFIEKLIPLTIYNAINYKPITIYGDGSNIRDWLYVDDHCDAIKTIINKGSFGEVYNIGGNNEFKNIDIVNKICEILDYKSPITNKNNSIKLKSYKELITFIPDRPGHDYRYSIDSSKIINSLNWKPAYSFNTGIEKTVSWYLENQDWIKSLDKN